MKYIGIDKKILKQEMIVLQLENRYFGIVTAYYIELHWQLNAKKGIFSL